MKIIKTIAFVASLMLSAAVQAKSSSNSDSYPKLGQACMVDFSNAKTTRFVNANTIRFIEVTTENPTALLISILSNSHQDSKMGIAYPTKEEASAALIKIVSKINQCGES